MTNSTAARAIQRWVRFYTLGLPEAVRERRRGEVDADLWSELTSSAFGQDRTGSAADMLLRLVAGVPDDITWRLSQRRRHGGRHQAKEATVEHRGLGFFAILGGAALSSTIAILAWATLADPTLSMDQAYTQMVPGVYLIVAGLVGFLALSATMLASVVAFEERIHRWGILAAVVGGVGMLLGAKGGPALFMAVPASALLVWDLALIGAVRPRVAASMTISAFAFVLPAWQASTGGSALGVGSLLLLPWPFAWVALGAALWRGEPVSDGTVRPAAKPAAT